MSAERKALEYQVAYLQNLEQTEQIKKQLNILTKKLQSLEE